MTYKIMIIEDDVNIAQLLAAHLKKFGFDVYCCQEFTQILEEYEEYAPHLILLDINLPAFDGFYWCGKLRTKTSCPILFLSSRSSDTDQVYAMVNGGDDYITKPFSFEVVTAKVNAHIRRVYGEYAVAADQELGCGDCTFYKGKLMLQCNEEKAMLSKTEAGIIKLLFEAYPNVVSRENLLNEIWDDESFVEENTLNVTISRLRKRLAGIHSELRINPVRGVGYRIGVKTDEV